MGERAVETISAEQQFAREIDHADLDEDDSAGVGPSPELVREADNDRPKIGTQAFNFLLLVGSEVGVDQIFGLDGEKQPCRLLVGICVGGKRQCGRDDSCLRAVGYDVRDEVT
jgi:hypothetical protein